MRPRRLRASAFGPFATSVEIDFSELGHRNLLLIEGPTGAGKTSLLDAMTYALFGAVPGARHEIEGELKSGFAEPQAVCEVELEFALGERTYIARRRPAQERAKKRGVGRVSKPPEASLVEILADGTQSPVCLSKASEVDAAVERLLGLKVEQFQKVLLLPQGEFRELLLARSADKEQLLERLFGTALYADAVRRLGEERRNLERRAEELRRGVADLLEQHGAATVEGLATSASQSVLDLDKARQAAKRLGEAAAHARHRHEQAARLAERLRERDDARKEATLARDALAGAESTRARLAEAERAERVRPALERAELEQGRAARLAAESVLAGQALAEAEAVSVRAAAACAELATSRELAQRARDRRAVLAELAPVAEQAEAAAREAAAVGKRIVNGQAHVADVEQKRVATAAELAALAAPLAAAGAAAAELPARLDLANAAGARLAGRRELGDAEGRVKAAQHSLARLDGELPALRIRLDETRAQLRLRREARENNLAAELAATLVPGESCPVCGGHEHPAPARARQAVSVQQVGEAERQAQELADKLAERERERARLHGQAEEHDKRAAELRTGFGQDSLEAAQSAAAAAQTAREVAERAAAELPRLEARRGQLTTQLELQAKQLASAHAALAELDKSHAAHAARAKELADRLSAALPPGTQLGQALAAASAEIQRLEGALARADAARESADKALAAARERHERGQQATQEARLDAAEHAAAAETSARAAGFADAAEARRQLVPPAALEAERRALLGLANRNIDASARAAAAEKALAGVDMAALADAADLPARRKEADLAERESSEASTRKGQLEERVEQLRQAAERAARREGEYERVAAALTMLGQLARVVGGENPLRMSLPRYVLAARMEEVAVAASERFFAMSRGRYRLRRTDEVRHAGRGSGLDLVVDDAMTGHERAVHSLSGGEMFMASLSLAMGLADVVQSHAGGIRLDSLFIDEGFGTLDDETLDQVMRTLEDLRAGGRLVGLISHVAELKERIPTRLTVSKATRGSTARLVVG